jgi:hypothetical protein
MSNKAIKEELTNKIKLIRNKITILNDEKSKLKDNDYISKKLYDNMIKELTDTIKAIKKGYKDMKEDYTYQAEQNKQALLISSDNKHLSACELKDKFDLVLRENIDKDENEKGELLESIIIHYLNKSKLKFNDKIIVEDNFIETDKYSIIDVDTKNYYVEIKYRIETFKNAPVSYTFQKSKLGWAYEHKDKPTIIVVIWGSLDNITAMILNVDKYDKHPEKMINYPRNEKNIFDRSNHPEPYNYGVPDTFYKNSEGQLIKSPTQRNRFKELVYEGDKKITIKKYDLTILEEKVDCMFKDI